jgi:ParB-like chromosome segregation protein Spo0J
MINQKHAGLVIHKVRLEDAQPHPLNPRIHPASGTPEWAALEASLKESYFDPLVVNERNGQLVSGHYRRKVMLEMGIVSADMVVVDWDEETHLARMIAANRLLGEDDNSKLIELLQGLESTELTGMTQAEIDEIVKLPETKFKIIAVKPSPKIAWALISIPLEKYGTIQGLIDQIIASGANVKTTVNDGEIG